MIFAALSPLSQHVGEWVGIIGVLLTIFGVILTIRSRSKARLVYQARSYTIIGSPDVTTGTRIKLLFDDISVPRVVVTHLAVWNAGNTTIRRDDIVAADPLTVSSMRDRGTK
jgi:hypothetical protein